MDRSLPVRISKKKLGTDKLIYFLLWTYKYFIRRYRVPLCTAYKRTNSFYRTISLCVSEFPLIHNQNICLPWPQVQCSGSRCVGSVPTVGAQSIACAQSIAHSHIGDNTCKKNLNFWKIIFTEDKKGNSAEDSWTKNHIFSFKSGK